MSVPAPTAEHVAVAAALLLRATGVPPPAEPATDSAAASATSSAGDGQLRVQQQQLKRPRTAEPQSVPASMMAGFGGMGRPTASASASVLAAASAGDLSRGATAAALMAATIPVQTFTTLMSTPEPVPDFASAAARKRRERREWTPEEIRDLERGVATYGAGKWSRMLHDPDLSFNGRTVMNLKDKWRALKEYEPRSAKTKRRYVLLDAQHRPVMTENLGLHLFTNHWPRDAALKVASRTKFYELDGVKREEISIFLREFVGNNPRKPGNSATSDTVHVFVGRRTFQPVPSKRAKDADGATPAKFFKAEGIWVPEVRKVREEKYLYLKEAEQFLPLGDKEPQLPDDEDGGQDDPDAPDGHSGSAGTPDAGGHANDDSGGGSASADAGGSGTPRKDGLPFGTY